MRHVLLLGGTAEASQLALTFAARGVAAIFSYAGRTSSPARQPLATRVGGFGGIEGLVAFIRQRQISHVVDATHPFAAQMSRHALAACKQTGTPLIALERPPWQPGADDDWRPVGDVEAAANALPETQSRIFLGLGRQWLHAFAARPQHVYLLRLVDPPQTPPPLPACEIVVARGPFTLAGDLALLRSHRITHVVARNAGGEGAIAKLHGARALRLPVIMIDRPVLPPRRMAQTADDVMHWLGHGARSPADRGV